MKPQLQQGLDEATKGYQQLESGKMTAVNEITKGEVTITTTEQSLDEADQQLKDAQKQFEEARDAAYEKADLHGILTPELISNILMAQNFSMPAGYLRGRRPDPGQGGRCVTPARRANAHAALQLDAGRLEEVTPVGRGRRGAGGQRGETYAKVNGNDGILLSFQKQSTASTTDVADRIEKEIAALTAANEGLHVTPLMDQGDYIHLIIDSVLQNLLSSAACWRSDPVLLPQGCQAHPHHRLSIPISLLFAIR